MTSSDIAERFNGLRRYLVPVPAVQPGICPVCRTGLTEDYTTCRHCSFHTDISILPISISCRQEPLHDRLRKYKRSSDASVRRAVRIELGTILSVFLDHHESCLGGDIDIVACPPSTQQPAGVQDIVGMFTRRFPGNVNPLSWDDPEQRTVKVSPTVADARVLLIDDTFTKGNRAVFPTAAALRRAGAEVLGPLVIGREFNPDYGNNDRIWRQLKGAEYDVTKCARCAGFRFDPPLRPGEQTQLFDH